MNVFHFLLQELRAIHVLGLQRLPHLMFRRRILLPMGSKVVQFRRHLTSAETLQQGMGRKGAERLQIGRDGLTLRRFDEEVNVRRHDHVSVQRPALVLAMPV